MKNINNNYPEFLGTADAVLNNEIAAREVNFFSAEAYNNKEIPKSLEAAFNKDSQKIATQAGLKKVIEGKQR